MRVYLMSREISKIKFHFVIFYCRDSQERFNY